MLLLYATHTQAFILFNLYILISASLRSIRIPYTFTWTRIDEKIWTKLYIVPPSTEVIKISTVLYNRIYFLLATERNILLWNSPKAVMLYDGKGSCPKPGLMVLQIRSRSVLCINKESRIYCLSSLIFLGREFCCVFTPCTYTRTLKDIIKRMCWSQKIDIASCRSAGIKLYVTAS